MKETNHTPDDPTKIDRRQMVLASLLGGLTVYGILLGQRSKERANEAPDFFIHEVTASEAEQGPESIVSSFFPELNEAEIEQYIQSGLFVNITAEADKRKPTDLKEKDTIELYRPAS